MKVRVGGDDEEAPRPGGSGVYPVGIVGEANYQSAIRRCSVGQRVRVLHELGNPYDERALAVVTADGQTIGYIARDCWLQDAVHGEGRGCDATIKAVSSSGGMLGIVLDVSLTGLALGTRDFIEAVRPLS